MRSSDETADYHYPIEKEPDMLVGTHGGGEDRTGLSLVMSFFMYSRAVILVTIIVSTGPVVRDITFAGDLVARVRPNPPENNQWFWLVVPMAGFALVSLVGRGRSHPAPALFAEGIIATVFFLTPPFQWVKWFGLNNDFVDASGGTLGAFGLMQPLSAMWLGVVIATALSGNKRARSLGKKALTASEG